MEHREEQFSGHLEGEHPYAHLADELGEMQASKNNGRGVECVRWIVDDLRRGDIDAARADYRNQSDKYDNYPDIRKFLKDAGIAGEMRFGAEETNEGDSISS